MGTRLRHFAAATALLLAQAASGSASAELVVIVSARNPLPALSGEQVAAIFLGQAGRFPDGAEAVALDQRLGSQERQQFYAQVTGKTPALLTAHWSKMVFTGRGQPPAELPDSAAVRRRVAEDPEAIGYIERGALDGSVHAVLVVQ